MADEFCPTCHSRIAPNATEDRLKQGDVEEGTLVEITDENNETRLVRSSTSGAVPQWTDDPGLTLRGFNGEEYIGRDAIRGVHLKEIQDARRAEEEEVGLSPDQKTKFSNITDDGHVRGPHLTQLRESTEKILNAVGSSLAEYFSLDANEEEAAPGPNDEENKEEWTDVARGEPYLNRDGEVVNTFLLPNNQEELSPTFPANTHVRLIHIEDLRRPLHLGWREFWSVTEEVQPYVDVTPDDAEGLITFLRDFIVDSETITASQGITTTTVSNITERNTSVDTITDKNLQTLQDTEVTNESGTPGQPGFSSTTTKTLIKRGEGPNTAEDIYPTDGGMPMSLYQTTPEEGDPINEKTWYATLRSFKRSRDVVRTFEGDGAPSPIESHSAGTSEASIDITDTTDFDILELNGNSNKATLKCEANSDSEANGLGGTLSSDVNVPNAIAQVGHTWQLDNSQETAFFPFTLSQVKNDFLNDVEFKTRTIPVKRLTRFVGKITTLLDAEGFGPVNISLREDGVGAGNTGFANQDYIPNAGMDTGFGGAILKSEMNMVLRLRTGAPNPSNIEIIEIQIHIGERPDDPISNSKVIKEDDPTATFLVNTGGSPDIAIAKFVRGFEKGALVSYDIDLRIDKLLDRIRDEATLVGDSDPFAYTSQEILDEETEELVQNPDGTSMFFNNILFSTVVEAPTVINSVGLVSDAFASAQGSIEALRIINTPREE